ALAGRRPRVRGGHASADAPQVSWAYRPASECGRSANVTGYRDVTATTALEERRLAGRRRDDGRFLCSEELTPCHPGGTRRSPAAACRCLERGRRARPGSRI